MFARQSWWRQIVLLGSVGGLLGGLGWLSWRFTLPANSPADLGDSNPVVINQTAVPPVPTLEATRVMRGQALYAEKCVACHGVNLEGAPDWKKTLPDGSWPAPPHDASGHTWHHPDALLLNLIANGGDPAYKSKMPAFQNALTADEQAMILDFLKSQWGRNEREFQWWMTATGNGH